ncbi:MAG: hypothetical protein FLDDKLPJ_02270 [Phycisphaerae bacterium]|nr:hypothetical protein [Phycisphaerae bacterium]
MTETKVIPNDIVASTKPAVLLRQGYLNRWLAITSILLLLGLANLACQPARKTQLDQARQYYDGVAWSYCPPSHAVRHDKNGTVHILCYSDGKRYIRQEALEESLIDVAKSHPDLYGEAIAYADGMIYGLTLGSRDGYAYATDAGGHNYVDDGLPAAECPKTHRIYSKAWNRGYDQGYGCGYTRAAREVESLRNVCKFGELTVGG